MSKPQQPELARSGRGATDPHAIKTELTAPQQGTERDLGGGPVPADNRPGHRPDEEQDKPDGAAFVEKMHRLAEREAAGDAPGAEAAGDDRTAEEPPSDRAERLARAAGTPFRVAGDALQKVRDRL